MKRKHKEWYGDGGGHVMWLTDTNVENSDDNLLPLSTDTLSSPCSTFKPKVDTKTLLSPPSAFKTNVNPEGEAEAKGKSALK